ncbi:hypothetical protein RXV95_00540 [Novosphingobium sp. ZN18A2]|uniref:hypothetical protein n=1 Tax=Novosphingobium sp. ZN18A2 TaxID=3079861 RepID=UPI0030CFB226
MEGFQFGRTLSRTFSILGASVGTVGVFVLLLQIVSAGLNTMATGRLKVAATGDAANPAAIFLSPWYWAMLFVGFAIGAVLAGGAISGFLSAARGESGPLGDLFRAGLGHALPVLGLMILWTIGISLGFALLIVPGLILVAMWAVCLPVLIGEGGGVFASFGRSRALTKGARWKILAVLIVAVVIIYVPIMFAGGMAGAIGGSAGAAGMLRAEGTPVGFVFSVIFGWIMMMVVYSLLTSIYLETKLALEGSESGGLGGVFE